MDKRYNDYHFGGEGSLGFFDVKKSTPYSEVLGNLEEEVGGGVQCQSLFSALSGSWAYRWCTTLKVPSTWKMTKQCQLSNSHPYCAFEPCCSNWKEIRHRGKLAFLSCHLSGLPLQCQEVENCTGSPSWERPGSMDLLGSMTLASRIFLISVSLWIVIQDLNFQNIPFTIPNGILILVLTVSSQGGRLDLLLACWFLALTRMFLVLMSAQPKP